MAKKLKYVIEKIIVKFNVINLSVKLNSPYLTTKIALKLIRFLNVKSDHTVLCLGRPTFNNDIAAMSELSGRINYQIVPKIIFTSIFNYYLSDILQSGIHTKYHDIKGYEKNQAKYSNYLNKFFDYFFKEINVSGVISANYVYAWQQEIAKICLERGIPFIVLQKEGVVAKKDYYDSLKNYTNNNFIGTKLLVYNNNLKNAFLRLKIKGLTNSKIETVGIPRFDKYFKMTPGGQNLVFFSFYVIDKIRASGLNKKITETYINNAEKFHIEVMKFASKNKDINVIIKTKDSERYHNYVVNLAKDNSYINLNNLTITNNANPYNLIENSKCVIGFNSMTLIEGLMANKILISPDIIDDGVNNYFDEYPELINYASNYFDIEKYYYGNSSNNFSLKKQIFLSDFLFKDDGKSSERAENSILKILEDV